MDNTVKCTMAKVMEENVELWKVVNKPETYSRLVGFLEIKIQKFVFQFNVEGKKKLFESSNKSKTEKEKTIQDSDINPKGFRSDFMKKVGKK